MKLQFNKIINGSIFEDDFKHLDEHNGKIEFKQNGQKGGCAILYAPNGTGKSSFAKVLKNTEASETLSFEATDDNGTINPQDKRFHVIENQISRNIIPGEEQDYLVGKDIQREFELKDLIDKEFEKKYSDLRGDFKKEYKISKMSAYFIEEMNSQKERKAQDYIKIIVNVKNKWQSLPQDEFLEFVKSERTNWSMFCGADPDIKKWIIEDVNSKESVIECLRSVNLEDAEKNSEIRKINQIDDAIKLMEKYPDEKNCVLCDAEVNLKELLQKKEARRNDIYDSLNEESKKLLDKIVKSEELDTVDPLHIKSKVLEFIETGELIELNEVKMQIDNYIEGIKKEIICRLAHCFDDTNTLTNYEEYIKLTESNAEISSEELFYIEKIIDDNIGRKIKFERDESSRKYILKIGDDELLGTDRENIKLSTGEQNFISLAFELLYAKQVPEEYIVIDDPISSFDSIYKNKIVFCIVKFLENKKTILLTHNLELIRLMNAQSKGCFELHLFNNTSGGRNGFIKIDSRESKILTNLHELIRLFRNEPLFSFQEDDDKKQEKKMYKFIEHGVLNPKHFLMAMVPFMRGYEQLCFRLADDKIEKTSVNEDGEQTSASKNEEKLSNAGGYQKLSEIMHGYTNTQVNLTELYEKLFGYKFEEDIVISSNDVLNQDLNDLQIMKNDDYPLLAETLKQSFIYYQLRLTTEKELVEIYSIKIKTVATLGCIINQSFKNESDFKNRVFFNSKKSLVNEFNHFEGNMNIFQPALDITPEALDKEVKDIENKLKELREEAEKSVK